MKNLFYIIIFVAFASTLLFIISCNENAITDSSQIVFPDSNVSFNNHVYPYMKLSCSYSGCHSDETMAGGRRMTDHISYFESANTGLVIPADPNRSYLIQILEGKSPHPGYVYWKINDNQKKGMRRWVQEGARNN